MYLSFYKSFDALSQAHADLCGDIEEEGNLISDTNELGGNSGILFSFYLKHCETYLLTHLVFHC